MIQRWANLGHPVKSYWALKFFGQIAKSKTPPYLSNPSPDCQQKLGCTGLDITQHKSVLVRFPPYAVLQIPDANRLLGGYVDHPFPLDWASKWTLRSKDLIAQANILKFQSCIFTRFWDILIESLVKIDLKWPVTLRNRSRSFWFYRIVVLTKVHLPTKFRPGPIKSNQTNYYINMAGVDIS
jgi:hypothetical protein